MHDAQRPRTLELRAPPRPVSISARLALILGAEIQLALLVSGLIWPLCPPWQIRVGADVIAFAVAFGFIRRGLARARLLAGGALGFARILDKTVERVDEGTPEYRYTFEIDPADAPGGYRQQMPLATRRFEVATHESDRVEDDAREPVVYFPHEPGSGLVLDLLPIRATVDGGFDSDEPAAKRLILPGLWIVAHLIGHILWSSMSPVGV